VDVEVALAALEADRRHGAGYLARKALGLLAAAAPAERPSVGERLLKLRPAMPAIAAAVREALNSEDPRAVLRRADAERRRIAELAAGRLRGKRVATISNSSLVARALLNGRPPQTEVVIQAPGDEGYLLLAELQANGLATRATTLEAVAAEAAIVGCDAIFDDGVFVNRRGTADLVRRMEGRPVLVLAERWKRVPGRAPGEWPEPDLFEIVPPAGNVVLVST
jgi:translation initiation factor 2B subunit (eIF-2B alpha/beta/delta family)